MRAALASANANSPKGAIEEGGRRFQLYTNDQATHAADYRPLVIAYRNGAPVGLTDVGQVDDSVEDVRNEGLANGKPAVLVIVFRQSGANIIETVDRVKAELPRLGTAMPTDVEITVASDRSITIRASLRDTELTLLIAVVLVTAVMFLFLGDLRSTLIPAVAVPIAIIGTFGAMYLLGYSLDNLSLMALTISTGFVVDDAIVVVENITRYIEDGKSRTEAALRGAAEVGFTVLSISISLIAVFIPIMFMGGILGRMFREFAVTLSMAILVSLLVSLTTTPMMCALLLRARPHAAASRRLFARLLRRYERSLAWALRHGRLVMLVLLGTVCLNVVLYVVIPKGFFPQQDTGSLLGIIQADQSISFQLMRKKLAEVTEIVRRDPAVQSVVGFTGLGGGGVGGETNTATVFVGLKPLAERRDTADQIIARLREQLSLVPGATLFLQAVQDIRIGGRLTNAQFQYTLQSDAGEDLYAWSPKLVEALQHSSVLVDVNSDQQQSGRETNIVIDRATAGRLGLPSARSKTRSTMPSDNAKSPPSTAPSISTMSSWRSRRSTGRVRRRSRTSSFRPPARRQAARPPPICRPALSRTSALRHTSRSGTATAGRQQFRPQRLHQRFSERQEQRIGRCRGKHERREHDSACGVGSLRPRHHAALCQPSRAVRRLDDLFQPAAGRVLKRRSAEVARAVAEIHMPTTIRGSLQGTARAFQRSIGTEPFLILAALVTVYIVLGVLYESYIHPITILSTLPSAGVGAVLALIACKTEFSIIALIGVIC